jgi:hypothetical protein
MSANSATFCRETAQFVDGDPLSPDALWPLVESGGCGG